MEHSNIDPAVQRLLDFVESQGGPAEVSKRMGVRPQLFYNMKEGKSKFSMTTLVEMAATFPGLIDANFILFGIESGAAPVVVQKTQQQPPAAGDVSSLVAAKDQIIDKQNQLIEKLSNRVEILELRNETQAEQIIRLAERDFPGSDSHPTAETQHQQNFRDYVSAGMAHINKIGFEISAHKPAPSALINVLEQLNIIDVNGWPAVGPRKEVEVLV